MSLRTICCEGGKNYKEERKRQSMDEEWLLVCSDIYLLAPSPLFLQIIFSRSVSRFIAKMHNGRPLVHDEFELAAAPQPLNSHSDSLCRPADPHVLCHMVVGFSPREGKRPAE